MAVPAEARLTNARDVSEDRESTPAEALPEAQPAPDPEMLRCPNCGWQTVRRSQRRGLLDFALSAFSFSPFRCRSCNHRFYRFDRQPKEG